MSAFSGLRAMGIAPKSADSYYEEEGAPLGWSVPASTYAERGYSSRPIIPNYRDPVREQQNALKQMAQDYQYQRMQNELKNLPAVQSLEDIERQERMKSGLERLKMLGQKQELQNKLQQGQIDYWTPEGRRQLSQAVGMGTLSPSSLQAIRAASPKAEALADAVYNLNMADSPEALEKVLQSSDKSLHLEPDFREAFRHAQSSISRAQAENDKTLINRALESGMDQEEMMKYLNPDMTRVADKASFMKAYGEHIRTERAKKQIFTPAWRNEDEKLLSEAIKRQTTEPTQFDLEPVLRNMTKDVERDFIKNPASPEELRVAYQEWKTAPSKTIAARKKMAQDMLDQALGRAPSQQEQMPVDDKQVKALNLLKGLSLIK